MTTPITGLTRSGTLYRRQDIPHSDSNSNETEDTNLDNMSINGNDVNNSIEPVVQLSSGAPTDTTGKSKPKQRKIPKFSGSSDSDLTIEAFISMFDRAFRLNSDDDKVDDIMEFLTDDAANYYGSDILTGSDVTWTHAKQLLLDRYTHSDIPPVVAANRRRQQKAESIKQYYDEKLKLLRRVKNYTDNDKANLLTDGLIPDYREYFYGRRFKSTTEWLEMAQDIEADKSRNRHYRQPGSSHFTTDKNNDRFSKRFPNKRDSKDKSRPPYSCRICRDRGLTSWHYHKDCPHKPTVPQPVVTPNIGDSSQSTDTSNHYIRPQTMASAANVKSIILIPGRIGNFELSAFADPGSTVDLMPLYVAKHLRLPINYRRSTSVSLARGSIRTVGEVTFKLTINRMTRTMKAQVLNGFEYTLLMSIDSLGRYGVIIDTHSKTVSYKWSNKIHPFLRSTGHHCNYMAIQPTTNRLPTIPNKNVDQLIHKYSQIFAADSTDLGRIKIEEHRIVLTDNEPTAQRPYRQSFPMAAETARQVKDLLQKGLIRESVSPYAAPITLAPKKDGTYRLCVDYRRLNTKTVADKTPLPVIADVIDRLQGSTVFSKLDFASGYWQVAVSPEDIHKTAFVTRDGHYEWTVLPFGLKNSPATFHRVVHKILGNLHNNGVIL
ncbi:uncharacterized protein K02A2.6-like [Oppia nitens]|uniref:uncharacterized protein K02A2.6-like n=1 Tax=Oppia nitens TaxID=1686743 RepID=UPI0023D99066|nr:uncharacterized protein K02A2.6-like [Oppia nitens]